MLLKQCGCGGIVVKSLLDDVIEGGGVPSGTDEGGGAAASESEASCGEAVGVPLSPQTHLE